MARAQRTLGLPGVGRLWERPAVAGPAVESRPPPRALLRVANPIVRAVLRSPLHGLLSKRLMVLTVTGRRSGRTYSLPVGRYDAGDGALLLSAGGVWRHNLRGGADVRVTLDGRERRGHAVLVEDPDQAAEEFAALLDRVGPRALGVKLHVTRAPTTAEVKAALRGRGVAHLRLTD
jgi:deazaflavin-dependent oxidoreductase (nitroreductase family)